MDYIGLDTAGPLVTFAARVNKLPIARPDSQQYKSNLKQQ